MLKEQLAVAELLKNLVKGNTEIAPHVTVAYQSVTPKTKITVGSTVELTFTDTKAAD